MLTRSTGRAERYEWSDRVQAFTGHVLDPFRGAPPSPAPPGGTSERTPPELGRTQPNDERPGP